MTVRTVPFDASEFLASPQAQAELLADAFETADPKYISNALGIVAKAKGMTSVARDSGVSREALYKALSEKGDPKLSTLLGVMKALHMNIRIEPEKADLDDYAEARLGA